MRKLRNKFLKELLTNQQLLQEVIAFYNASTLEETAEHYNCNKTSLWRFFKEYNIPLNIIWLYNKAKADKNLLTEIINFYKTHSLNQTAKKYGCHNEDIRRLLEENNIALHSETELIKIVKANNLENFGTEWPMQSKEIMEKSKTTCRQNYEVDYYLQTKECIERTKTICQEKYGVSNVSQVPEIRQKQEQTNLERYGAISSLANREIIEKGKQTMIAKYGVESALQSLEILEKAKATNLKKYGTENPMQSEIVKAKMKQTNLVRYGFENPLASPEIRAKAHQTLVEHYGTNHAPIQKYFYQDEFFDSFPELCFYLYHIKNNIKIIREPIELNYEFEGKLYHYYPDFKVGDSIYEIKGDQFLAEDGSWCCPYDKSKDEQFELKHKCALENSIVILYEKDYIKYINWFHENGYKKEDFKFNKNKS